MGHGQEFALFSEGDGKPFKGFRQGSHSKVLGRGIKT